MKREYLIPKITVFSIDSDGGIMDNSISIHDATEDNQIADGSEILGNKNSIWDEE